MSAWRLVVWFFAVVAVAAASVLVIGLCLADGYWSRALMGVAAGACLWVVICCAAALGFFDHPEDEALEW